MKDSSGQLKKVSWGHALGAGRDWAQGSSNFFRAGSALPVRIATSNQRRKLPLPEVPARGAGGAIISTPRPASDISLRSVIQWEMLGYSGGTFGMEAIEKATAIVVIGADLKAESAGFAYSCHSGRHKK